MMFSAFAGVAAARAMAQTVSEIPVLNPIIGCIPVWPAATPAAEWSQAVPNAGMRQIIS